MRLSRNALGERIRRSLQDTISIKAEVELHEHGGPAVSEGKAKRVIDSRPKDL